MLEQYDIVLIGCRPALDQLTLNDLTAADVAATVTSPDLFSANDIAQLGLTIEAVRDHYNPKLRIGGVTVSPGGDIPTVAAHRNAYNQCSAQLLRSQPVQPAKQITPAGWSCPGPSK